MTASRSIDACHSFLNRRRRFLYRAESIERAFLIMLTARARPPFDYRVLAAANGVGERASDRLFTRWKKSLSRCCECCPSMRCLACRTDHKGFTWPRNHARSTTMLNRNEQPLPRDNVPTGCWPKFKNRCRYEGSLRVLEVTNVLGDDSVTRRIIFLTCFLRYSCSYSLFKFEPYLADA